MNRSDRTSGSMVIWNWGDYEIDNPRVLREQLSDIESRGFCGVLATIRGSRYEIVDKKVVRAIVQASQWTKARRLSFWIQADPRRASRTLIAETGEKMQCLLFTGSETEGGVTLGRIHEGRFNIRYPIPALQEFSYIQEKSVFFEPGCLERAFLFQMEDGQILRDTLIDVTPVSRFFANISKNEVEIFGEAGVSDSPYWRLLALPKFNTNLYDFAGRESNDRLHQFVEKLFDSAAYIDGVAWDQLGVDFMPGTIPVSESIYKGFLSEFGYDIRDYLYALVLELDDASHTRIRYDFTRFLGEVISEAHKDLLLYFNSYFGSVETLIPLSLDEIKNSDHGMNTNRKQIADRGLLTKPMSLAFSHIHFNMDSTNSRTALFAKLAIVRGEGVCSKTCQAYVSIEEEILPPAAAEYRLDLLALFSLRWMNRAYSRGKSDELIAQPGTFPQQEDWGAYITRLNDRQSEINRVTQFRFPFARTAVVLPVESLITLPSEISQEILVIILGFVGRLFKAGVQFDVLRSPLLENARLAPEGVRIRNRTYASLIFPYPLVITQQTLDLIATMRRKHYSVYFGGDRPEWLTGGERIHHDFEVHFDPESDSVEELIDAGIARDFHLPAGTIASILNDHQDRLLLAMPDQPGQSIRGELGYQSRKIELASTHRLQIYRLTQSGEINREL